MDFNIISKNKILFYELFLCFYETGNVEMTLNTVISFRTGRSNLSKRRKSVQNQTFYGLPDLDQISYTTVNLSFYLTSLINRQGDRNKTINLSKCTQLSTYLNRRARHTSESCQLFNCFFNEKKTSQGS